MAAINSSSKRSEKSKRLRAVSISELFGSERGRLLRDLVSDLFERARLRKARVTTHRPGPDTRHLDLDERPINVGGQQQDVALERVGARVRQNHRRIEVPPRLAREQALLRSRVVGVREQLPSRGVEQGQDKLNAALLLRLSQDRLACHRHRARP